ncbi:MAG: hypothetical protein JW924_04695, partial [Fusobacteriaceae bacterium]|nr:hypothetical protein [Fusobacteriaceae bacterium]
KVAKVAFIAFAGLGAGLIKGVQATSRDGLIATPLESSHDSLLPHSYFPSCFDTENPFEITAKQSCGVYPHNLVDSDDAFYKKCKVVAQYRCDHVKGIDRMVNEALDQLARDVEKITNRTILPETKENAKAAVFETVIQCLRIEYTEVLADMYFACGIFYGNKECFDKVARNLEGISHDCVIACEEELFLPNKEAVRWQLSFEARQLVSKEAVINRFVEALLGSPDKRVVRLLREPTKFFFFK